MSLKFFWRARLIHNFKINLKRLGWMPFLVLVAVVTSILVILILIDIDPKLKAVDKDYLVKKYLSDHQDSGANEVSSHDSLVQTLCKQLNLSRLPAPEPGVFTGNPLHYPSWKKAFDTLISTRAIPDEERLHYLKKYLGGDAKSCVEGFFLFGYYTKRIRGCV